MPGKEDAIAANRVRKGGQNGVRKGGISPKKGVFLTSGGGLDGVLARPKGLAETQKCHNLMYRSCVPTTAACLPQLRAYHCWVYRVPYHCWVYRVPYHCWVYRGPIPLLGVQGPIPLFLVQKWSKFHCFWSRNGLNSTVFG